MLHGIYNPWLVTASLIIAILASYTALDMAGRVSESQGKAARWWLIGGSAAMGIGIWSMHFLGMLAFRLLMPMTYDPLITFLSLLAAIAASAATLWTVCRPDLSLLRLGAGAVLMGGGICAMHYTGMAAMDMNRELVYIPSLVLLSIAIAILASGASLWIAFRLRQRSSRNWSLHAGAAVLMGLGIATMHYTGMAAARFPVPMVHFLAENELPSSWLAPMIILLALAVLAGALVLSMIDFRASVLATSLASAHQQLQFLTLHDNLTKLPNQTLLNDRLEQEIENAKRNHRAFSVLVADLDGFKSVNDAFGHHTGDRLLVEMAQRLRATVRARDTVARPNGDRFVVLAETLELSDAVNLAERLIAVIQQPCEISGHTCQVTASIGIAMINGEDAEQETVFANAVAAMYHAKALGRNNYCFFEAWMQDSAQKQLQVFNDLSVAMARQEFALYYQPKFDAKSGAILGVEALIRWLHPTRGLISPGEFIPMAEKIGLILPIGEWTIEEACKQISEWKNAGYASWTVAVNLSAVQFKHPRLIEFVQCSLDRYGLDPGSLVLEITESTAMCDPDISLNILQKLRQIGVRISIDDFGTGYSSLLYLKRLHASELKIDRGFVHELSPGSEDAAIISAIVALGRTLNLEIVAEGVETVEQRDFLTSIGCNALQGFLFGRPMPPDQLMASLEQGTTSTWELKQPNPGPLYSLIERRPANA